MRFFLSSAKRTTKIENKNRKKEEEKNPFIKWIECDFNGNKNEVKNTIINKNLSSQFQVLEKKKETADVALVFGVYNLLQ